MSSQAESPQRRAHGQSQRSTQTQSGAGQSQQQRQQPLPPGEDPGTLGDEDYLQRGGPDAIDSAADPHPDSPPGSRRDQVEDPERGGGAEEK